MRWRDGRLASVDEPQHRCVKGVTAGVLLRKTEQI